LADDPVVGIHKRDPLASIPRYETAGAAGADLRARLSGTVHIAPMDRRRIPTGLVLEIPPGYEAQVRPRSGLADRWGLTVLNAPGTIDSDYRGELEVLLINLGSEPVAVHDGDRIAQLVIAPVSRPVFAEKQDVSGTERGGGGFGSTGV
jgi:dUTP pyrophosphatase